MARSGLRLADRSRRPRGYETRVRELIERSDPIFVMMIEAMLDVRQAILEGYERLHKVLLQVVQHDAVVVV